MYVSIVPSKIKHKKYTAVFYDSDKKKVKTTHFGDNRYDDYTQHHDKMRKANYINRHKSNEDWTDYTRAGTLSRFILWEYKNIDTAIKAYMRRFNLKAY